MTDSTPPRTLRDDIADEMLAGMKACWAMKPSERPPLSQRTELLAAADAVLASFDIRPHNEPAAENEAEFEIRGLHRLLDQLGAPTTIYNPYDREKQLLNAAGRLDLLLDPKNEGLTRDRIERMLAAARDVGEDSPDANKGDTR